MKRNLHTLRRALKTGDVVRIKQAAEDKLPDVEIWIHDEGPNDTTIVRNFHTGELRDRRQIDFSKGNQIVYDEDDLNL